MYIVPHFYNEKLQINQTSEDSLIAGRLVPKGYVNATQMCKANNKTWSNYWKSAKAQSFADKVSTALLNGSPAVISIEGGNDKDVQGTWVHVKVALHLAIWISDDFAIWATDVLQRVINGEYQSLQSDAYEAKTKLDKLWKEVRKESIDTRRTLTDAIQSYIYRHPDLSDNYRTWIYANTTDAMYKAVFAMKATELESFLGCGRHESRDYLSRQSLKQIDFAEDAICRQIDNNDIEPMQAVKICVEFLSIKKVAPIAKVIKND